MILAAPTHAEADALQTPDALIAAESGSGPLDTLINQMLAYAVTTQQRLAEQQARIAYLETLAETDDLTGLLNRRGFLKALDRSLAFAARDGQTGLLCYVDLDGFKGINDTLGHDAGDAVLMHVASTLRREVRLTDYVARLGGDEFALLLVDAHPLAARRRLVALRDGLNASHARLSDCAVEAAGGQHSVPVRASFGMTAYGPKATPEALLRRADQAMYATKRRRAGS